MNETPERLTDIMYRLGELKHVVDSTTRIERSLGEMRAEMNAIKDEVAEFRTDVSSVKQTNAKHGVFITIGSAAIAWLVSLIAQKWGH